mgnify:CR=1 FL=1
MAYTIAVAGKGGVGKTTLAGLIIRLLAERDDGPVLAVDADANANLNVVLGMDLEKTIGDLREELLDNIRDLSPGMTKDTYLELGLEECLVEGSGVDLLAMGHGEGQRCYCAVNHVLRRYMDKLSGAYRYVVMDNEAGLEHVSRTTTQDVDLLLVVAIDTPVALQSAARIHDLVGQLDLNVAKLGLVVNNVNGTDPERLRAHVDRTGLELLGVVPRDEGVLELSWAGESVMALPEDAPALEIVRELMETLLPVRTATTR